MPLTLPVDSWVPNYLLYKGIPLSRQVSNTCNCLKRYRRSKIFLILGDGYSMGQDWREFEELVAKIEQTLSPVEAIVKSPDWIVNNITGRKREVDASIRYTVGTVPILITVECRKRKYKQDDTWIEQLVTKKQNLGAARTIAVTSQGISEQAKKNALFYGIEVRKISEIAQEEMLGWIKINEVNHVVYHRVVGEGVGLDFDPLPDDETGSCMLHPSVEKRVKADTGNSQVFVRHSDGKTFSLFNILDAAVRNGLELYSGIPLDGTKVRKNVKIDLPKGTFHILTERGPRDVTRLVTSVDVNVTVVKVPVPETGFSYAGSGAQSIYGVEATTELFGKSVTVSFLKKEGSDLLYMRITKKNGNKKKSIKKEVNT